MNAVQPSIALIGKQGVGKTRIAEALAERGYNRHSWAGPVKLFASWAYGPINKARMYEVTQHGLPVAITGREILQQLATEQIRDGLDTDFWVRVGTRKLDDANAPYVNDDTRFPNELDALARRGWVIVRVTCPEELREQRIIDRDGAFDPASDQHASETSLADEPVHLTLHNTGTPALVADTLIKTIEQAIANGGVFTNRA